MSMILESLQIQSRPGDNTGAGTLNAQLDSTGLKAVSPSKVMQDSNVCHDKMMFTFQAAAASVTIQLAGPIAEGRWQVSNVTEYHQTGSTSGTLQVEVLTGTTAPGSGTAQLSSTISLAAATQQVSQNGTLIASPTVMAPGDRLGLVFAGTMTSLANAIITVHLKRIA